MDKIIKSKIFFRSLFLKAGWNFKKFQNIGFLFVMLPTLRKIYKDDKKLKTVIKRNMEVFNTNPIMSSFAFGVLTRLEEEISKTKKQDIDKLEEHWRLTKDAITTASASIGDNLFLEILRDFSLIVTVFLSLIFAFSSLTYTHANYLYFVENIEAVNTITLIIPAIAMLLTYNITTLIIRWRGLEFGYNCTKFSCYGLRIIKWEKLIRNLKIAGLILVLITAIYWLVNTALMSSNSKDVIITTLEAGTLVTLSILLKKKGFTTLHLYFLCILAGCVVSFIVV